MYHMCPKNYTKLMVFPSIIGLSHRQNFNYKNVNFFYSLIKEHLTILWPLHSQIHAVLLLSQASRISLQLSFLLHLFLFLLKLFYSYILHFGYLMYPTIMDRGLDFINFFGFPSQCDLSMSSDLIFWFLCSSVSSPSTPSIPGIKTHLRLEYCSCLSRTASIAFNLPRLSCKRYLLYIFHFCF